MNRKEPHPEQNRISWQRGDYRLAGEPAALLPAERSLEQELHTLLEEKEEAQDYHLYRNLGLTALGLSTLLTLMQVY